MFKRFLIFSVISFLCFTGAVFAQPDIGLGTASGIAQQGGLSTAGATQTGLGKQWGAMSIGRLALLAPYFCY